MKKTVRFYLLFFLFASISFNSYILGAGAVPVALTSSEAEAVSDSTGSASSVSEQSPSPVYIGTEDELHEASENLGKALDRASKSGFVVKRRDNTAGERVSEGLRSIPAGTPRRRCQAPGIFYFSEKVRTPPLPIEEGETPVRQITGYDNITTLGQDFVKENGAYNHTVGISLAQAFLAQGLGEEARAIALLLRGDEADLLAQMGDIVAQIDLPDTASLRGAGACFEHDMPWRIMANLKAQPKKSLNLAEQYQPYFESLPAFLAFDFATRLAVSAIEDKSYKFAGKLVEIAKNYPAYLSPRLKYLEAFLLAQDGSLQGVSDLLTLAREQGEMQAEALFALGDIEDLGKISSYDDYITDVEAVSEKYVKGDKSDLALFYEIRALARTGRFLTAIEKLNRDKGVALAVKEDAISVISSQLLIALLDKDDTRRLPALSAYLKYRDIFSLGAEEQINLLKEAIALSYTLSLPNLSLSLIADLPEASRTRREEFITAWAYIEKGNPQRAFNTAQPYIEEIDFLEIAAKSLFEMGLPDEAMSLFSKMPRTAERDQLRAELAWRSNEWTVAANSFDEVIKNLDNQDNNNTEAVLKRDASTFMGKLRDNEDISSTEDRGPFTYRLKPARQKRQIDDLLEQSREEINTIERVLNRG